MSEGEEVKRRRRRSSQEIQRLVAEFRTSGLRQSEYCRIHGLTHGTLQRGLRRERIASGSQEEIKAFNHATLAAAGRLLPGRRDRRTALAQSRARRSPLPTRRVGEPGKARRLSGWSRPSGRRRKGPGTLRW